jgi:hypothetical protein
LEAPPRLTAHLVEVEQAASRVSMGHMSIEEFSALVLRLEALFQNRLNEINCVDVPEDFQAELQEELAVGKRGIELYLDSMQDFKRYVEERALSCLSSGVGKSRAANELVNEALRLNWVTYDTYRRALEEYAEEMGVSRPAASG